MVSQDETVVGTLRLLKNALKNKQIELGHELKDDEVISVLKSQAKQRKDSISSYERAGRNELADDEKKELAIIERYLPAALSEAEIEAAVTEVIDELNATDISQMGVVIGRVMSKLGSAADGGTVSELVRQKLTS